MILASPYPWFGGKARVAHLVWPALGDVEHYVEPFFGGGAILLNRPTEPRVETINDIDLYVVNFWRSVQKAPEEVAYHANNLVNESDLIARHIWLVNTGAERIARLEGDPDYYDAKVAGWWVWGINCWIGSGWCSGRGPWSADADGKLVKNGNEKGVNRQRPYLGNAGIGINAARGVSRQLPHLSNPGRGINAARGVSRQPPHLGDAGQKTNAQRHREHADTLCGVRTGEAELGEYFNRLAERLRRVRVCCGDWSRVVTPGALAHGKTVGVFLDPPYDQDMRSEELYNHDTSSLSVAVREWCIANQDNPRYRIVLCGYEGEHDLPGWRVVAWKAGRAYGNANGETSNSANRHKERIWFSPNCLTVQKSLFDG
jgi:site-specific DNA-adenine methylase